MANFLALQGLNLPAAFQAADAAKANELNLAKLKREEENQNILSQYAGPAIEGDQEAYKKIAGVNPQLAVSISQKQSEQKKADLDRAIKEAPYVARALNGVQDQASYDQAKSTLQQMGINTAKMPTMYAPELVKRFVSAAGELEKYGQPVQAVGPDGKPTLLQVGDKGGTREIKGFAPYKEDNQLVEIADPTSPTGTRMVPRAQAVNQPGKPPNSMTLQSDGKGGFTLVQGRQTGKPDNAGLAQPTVNEIEKEITNNNLRLDRLSTVGQGFKEEYLRFGPQVANWATAKLEKMGVNFDPQTRKQLADYTTFRANAFNDLTRTLKEMSGAAVTPQEADRLLKSIGDPDNDSPTQFKAKYDATVRSLKLAQARLVYMRKNGIAKENMGNLDLEDMNAIIGNRIRQAEAQNKERGMQADQAYDEARKAVAAEFGMKI